MSRLMRIVMRMMFTSVRIGALPKLLSMATDDLNRDDDERRAGDKRRGEKARCKGGGSKNGRLPATIEKRRDGMNRDRLPGMEKKHER